MFKHLLCIVALSLLPVSGARANENAAVSGPWILTFMAAGETHAVRATLHVEGGVVTGNIYEARLSGTFQNDRLDLTMLNARGGEEGKLSGVLRDGKLSGGGTLWGVTLEGWAAVRPATPPPAPQAHTFDPTNYYRYLSSSYDPALRVFPADTVRTKLVDEDGRDENGKQRSVGGYPVVGPIYVEGALPGDLLAVHFKKVRVNRAAADSGHELIGAAAETEYLLNARRAKDFDADWKLDPAAGTASLAAPSARLGALALPVQPTVGIVGVAPPGRQAVVSRSGGDNFGGHLGYNEIGEDVTVYLPVFHEGALLFLGEGQAAQGDGQVAGEGIETSLDLEFTVDVLPRKSFQVPYAENASEMMFIGVGGSLEEALRRATTGLATYLEREYGLNASESATLLGVAAKYRIAKVSGAPDEQTTVVAKIPKAVLRQIAKPAPPKAP
jgi:acetamidase/formamidase